MKKDMFNLNGVLMLVLGILVLVAGVLFSLKAFGILLPEIVQLPSDSYYSTNGYMEVVLVSYTWGGVYAVLTLLWAIFYFSGLKILEPNEGIISTFFGKYTGEMNKDGFFYVNPFAKIQRYDLKETNVETSKNKINDKDKTPIEISMLFTYKIVDMYKAQFNAIDIIEYIEQQYEGIMREVVGQYTYAEISDDVEKVKEEMIAQANEALKNFGVETTNANVNYLAYAPEIAQAMLQKQQAKAVVDAKEEIVQGALGMVKTTIEKLESEHFAKDEKLSREEKFNLSSKLLTVLVSDSGTTPTIDLS